MTEWQELQKSGHNSFQAIIYLSWFLNLKSYCSSVSIFLDNQQALTAINFPSKTVKTYIEDSPSIGMQLQNEVNLKIMLYGINDNNGVSVE